MAPLEMNLPHEGRITGQISLHVPYRWDPGPPVLVLTLLLILLLPRRHLP